MVHCTSVAVFWSAFNCTFDSYFLLWAAAQPRLMDALDRDSRIRFRHSPRWGQGWAREC